MKAQDIQDVLERLQNLLRMESRSFGLKYGLQPVQIEALTYLAKCNRYSNTPQAVTEYLGLTKGTVSQSLKVLEGKGYIRKIPDSHDKRMVHLVPTVKGRKLVEQSISAKGLEKALQQCEQAKELEEQLRSLLRQMQLNQNRRTFAACHTCRFNERKGSQYFCGLTQEPLSREDIQLICREHEYPR